MPPVLASGEVAVAVFQVSEFTVVKLVRGNIEEVECDALVNSTSASMLLRKTQAVAGAKGVDISLRKAAGMQLEKEMSAISTTAKYIRLSSARPTVVTSGGDLKGRRVIHISVAPLNDWEKEDRQYQRTYNDLSYSENDQKSFLEKAYKAVFKCAETELPLITSLALPCLGCGGLKFRPHLSAEAAMSAIDPKTPISTITFVCHNNNTWTAFYQAAWTAFKGRMVIVPHPNTKREPPIVDSVLPVKHLQLFTSPEQAKAQNPSNYCESMDCWMLLPCLVHSTRSITTATIVTTTNTSATAAITTPTASNTIVTTATATAPTTATATAPATAEEKATVTTSSIPSTTTVTAATQTKAPFREDIGDHSSKIFALRDLLSSSDCKLLLECFDTHLKYEPVSWEYDHTYRDCERAVFKSHKLAEALFPAILQHMTVNDTNNVRPFGFGNQGTWRPYAINECFRLSRYSVGGHFAFHRDGSFVLTDDDRSVFTVLIYLNGAEEFKGGRTQIALGGESTSGWTATKEAAKAGLKKLLSFGKGKDKDGDKKEEKDEVVANDAVNTPTTTATSTSATTTTTATAIVPATATSTTYVTSLSPVVAPEKLKKVVEFKPNAGDVLIFPHDVLHAGETLTKGNKFILRTDIMFHRLDTASLSEYTDYRTDPRFLECQRLYDESILLQAQGDAKGSTHAYVRATELQAELASVRDAALASPMKQMSADTLSKAMSLLTPHDVLRCGVVSKAFYHQSRSDAVWRALMIRHFFSAEQANEAATPRALLSQSWFHSFKDRMRLEQDFQVLIIDPGYATTCYALLGKNLTSAPRNRGTWGEYDHAPPFSTATFASLKAGDPHSNKLDRYSDLEILQNCGRARSTDSRGSIPSIMRKSRGHYWSAFSGMKQYYVGDECYSSSIWFGAGPHTRIFHADKSANLDLWPVLLKWIPLFAFESILEVAAHPLLLIVPAWLCTEEGRNTLHLFACNAGFQRLWLVDQPVVLLRRADKDSGLVITFDQYTTVSLVRNQHTISVHSGLPLDNPILPEEKTEGKEEEEPHEKHDPVLFKEWAVLGGMLTQGVITSIVGIITELEPSLPGVIDVLISGELCDSSLPSLSALLVQEVTLALKGKCGHMLQRLNQRLDGLHGAEWLCSSPSVRESFQRIQFRPINANSSQASSDY